MRARNRAKPRWIARASVSLNTPKPTRKGRGEAYHSWNSDQAMATTASSAAAAPAGLRPPVSASATSCSSSALGCSPGVSVMTASPCLLMLEVEETVR
ncbi:hypothetical protein QFZ27_002789 [Inquilinus ginsengisoli]|uniref:hypothetical protein n=1 Tax=Inquilinus ginsengisoli TaxID=363840 RepID=UPI003D1D77EB